MTVGADPGPARPATTAAAPGAGAAAIAVVVPAFNAARHLGAALESLRAQTRGDWVCVIVDDGSTDATGAVAQAAAAGDARIRVTSQANAGVSAARTAGLAAVPAADLVCFLDADDLLAPTALEVLADALARRPDAVGAYGLAEYVDEDGAAVAPGVHPALQRTRRILAGRRLVDQDRATDTSFASLVAMNPIWPAAVGLHRREVVAAAGGFDRDLPVAEDWDLYLRMAASGPFVAVNDVVASYRRHGANLTTAYVGHGLMHEIVRYRAWARLTATDPRRLLVTRVWRFLLVRRAVRLLPLLGPALIARDGPTVALALRGIVLSAAQAVLSHPPRPRATLAKWSDPTGEGGALYQPAPADSVPVSADDRLHLLRVQQQVR